MNDHLDTVTFYCPNCGEMLFCCYHVYYICGCGKKWIIPKEPEATDGAKAIREINGEVK